MTDEIVEQTPQKTQLAHWALLPLGLSTTLFFLFTYTFLHEAGHAIAGLAFGQILTDFSVSFWDLSAHVGLTGGLTPLQRAVQSAAGAGLPVLVWPLFITAVPRKAGFALELLKLISSVGILSSLLVWVVIPLLYLSGRAPAGDDVTRFLDAGLIPPLVAAVSATTLCICGWLLFLGKIEGLVNSLMLFKQTDRALVAASTRTMLPAMAGVLAVLLALTLAAGAIAERNGSASALPPEGFQPLAQIRLDSRLFDDEVLAQFSLDETTTVDVFFSVAKVDTAYFDLSLVGPDGPSLVISHSEGFQAREASGSRRQELAAGTYRLVLTCQPSLGTLSVYLGYP